MRGKRKKAAAQDDAAAQERYEMVYELREYLRALVNYHLLPRRMAELRRRAGDPTASPRDYDCLCPVPEADGLPDCWPYRSECRFRHRMRPRPKVCRNSFAHKLGREILFDIYTRWPEIPSDEREDMIVKGMEELDAHQRRQARLLNEPPVEAAPLRENWRFSDLN